jgi:hypothetical protein
MRLKAVAVLALLASLALPLVEVSAQDGPEWPMYRADPQHTGACASAVPASLDGPLAVRLGQSALTSPVPSEGRILAASADGSLFIVGPASASPAATLEVSPARASTGEEVVFMAQNFSSPAGRAYGGMRVDFGDGRSSA